MDLIQDLRNETADAHRTLERELVKKIKSIRTSEDYVDLLHLMHGFYAAMESHLHRYLSGEQGLDFQKRRKAERIIEDIKTEGGAETGKSCHKLPAINSLSSALGAMYVLEGSTLGGQIITAMLKRQMERESDTGLSFFLGYGEETPRMWERFKSYLNREFSVQQQGEILRAANETFNSFHNWVQQYELEKTGAIKV